MYFVHASKPAFNCNKPTNYYKYNTKPYFK